MESFLQAVKQPAPTAGQPEADRLRPGPCPVTPSLPNPMCVSVFHSQRTSVRTGPFHMLGSGGRWIGWRRDGSPTLLSRAGGVEGTPFSMGCWPRIFQIPRSHVCLGYNFSLKVLWEHPVPQGRSWMFLLPRLPTSLLLPSAQAGSRPG